MKKIDPGAGARRDIRFALSLSVLALSLLILARPAVVESNDKSTFTTIDFPGAVQPATTTTNAPPGIQTGLPGSLDTTFGDGGIVTTSFKTISHPNAIAIQPDGKLLLRVTIFTLRGGLLPSPDTTRTARWTTHSVATEK